MFANRRICLMLFPRGRFKLNSAVRSLNIIAWGLVGKGFTVRVWRPSTEHGYVKLAYDTSNFLSLITHKHAEVPNSEIKLFHAVNVHIMRSFFW